MQPRSRIGEKFSTDKIHTGKFFRSGNFRQSLKGRAKDTLAGKLRDLKVSELRRTQAANLSADDLKLFHKLIGDRMKKTPLYSQGLNRRARMKIMIEAEHDAQKGIISREDKKDLRDIVKALSSQRSSEETGGASADNVVPTAENVAGGGTAAVKVGSAAISVPLVSSPILKSGQGARARPPSPSIEHTESHDHSVEPETQPDEEDEDADSKHLAPKPSPPAGHLPDIDFE